MRYRDDWKFFVGLAVLVLAVVLIGACAPAAYSEHCKAVVSADAVTVDCLEKEAKG